MRTRTHEYNMSLANDDERHNIGADGRTTVKDVTLAVGDYRGKLGRREADSEEQLETAVQQSRRRRRRETYGRATEETQNGRDAP